MFWAYHSSNTANGDSLSSSSSLVSTHTITDFTPTNDVGFFAVLCGYNLTTGASYTMSFDINGVHLGGNSMQITITSSRSVAMKVKSIAFAVVMWNRDKIESAYIPFKIQYQRFSVNSNTYSNMNNNNCFFGASALTFVN